MLFSILGWLTGLAGPISQIVGNITNLQIAKVSASTNQEKLKYDQQIAEAEDRKQILITEAGNRIAGILNASMRLLLALGPMLILLKVFLWDKVIGSFMGCAGSGLTATVDCSTFNTDPLDLHLWAIIGGVIAFYFAYDIYARSRK